MAKFEQSDMEVVKPGEKVNIKLNEFNKLVLMLDKAGIPYERDENSSMGMKYIHYPQTNNFVCSVIFGHESDGYEDGLLEIIGLLTEKEHEIDSVCSHLTADDVFQRIKKHFNKYYEEIARAILIGYGGDDQDDKI